MVPLVAPMPLVPIAQPFDHPAWIFELKYDGFRSLAFIEAGECRLVSRTGHVFKQFTRLTDVLARQLPDGIYDGEIVVFDQDGRSQFNALLFRRGTPVFAVVDLLWIAGVDLRALPLIERKRRLRAVVPRRCAPVLYVQHVAIHGVALFDQVCEQDLEGVVGKWSSGSNRCDGATTSWVKIKNRAYSQVVGRHELFEGRGRQRTAMLMARRLVLA